MKDLGPGLALLLAAALAMGVANGPWASDYSNILALTIASKSILHWINDGLMAVFFLVVGLEIARETQEGELADLRGAALPIAGAMGGMLAPAGVFLWVTGADTTLLEGAAIPTATDIAFALGIFALVRNRVAPGLRIFLLGLAVIDDLGAIVLIALLFTGQLSSAALAGATVCLVALTLLRRANVRLLLPYLVVGVLLWLSVLKSGVHATLAGVILGLLIPKGEPRHRLESALHPFVTWLVLPIFAFANAGASLDGAGWHTLADPLTLGIVLGLLLGKQFGVLAACWLAVRLGWAKLPIGADWRDLHGVAILTGIGFTMSLFIGSLAFPTDEHSVAIRVGVLVGSCCSAVLGVVLLLARSRRST